MTDTDTQHRGGWGHYDRLSPGLRARQLADDHAFEAARQADARRRADYAEYVEQQRIRAAVELAEARGEYVSMAQVARTGGACVGHTHGEFISYISAMQDVEDARERARQRVEYDPEQHQALLMAANPGVGRTRREAVAYYSALGDIQELEAARRQKLDLPSVEQEQASQRQDASLAARARDHRAGVVARGAACNVLNAERVQRYIDGEITEEQLRPGGRP